MKFDKQEWALRGSFASWSYEIQNHYRKAYSKTSIPWEEKILWCNHNYSDSRCNSRFNESKSLQIIVRTNIKQQLTPPPLSLNCSKRSVDSGNNFKATDAKAPPLWNQLTYSHFSEELTSLMRTSWNLTWRTRWAGNCSDSSVAGGNCGSSTISSADSAEHEGSWIRGAGWGSCTSEAVSIEPTVLWWSPRHCLQTPAYKDKPKMSFGSIVVY